ncbi:MAG TPA: UvrB/UvrC motif-containing protein [Spirochaetota bacterium]|nr:UvrB/UvrC motif-containing protein [Spirochaetota bacterium]
MKCDFCKINEAIFHIKEVSNNKKNTIHLCMDCAAQIGYNLSKDDINFLFYDFINRVFMQGSKNIGREGIPMRCPNCGIGLKEIFDKQIVGCEYCYNVFEKVIDNILIKNNNSLNYKGKYPKDIKEIIKRKEMLRELKNKLEECILIKDFKEAAVIRDKIKKLKRNFTFHKGDSGKYFENG